VKNCARRAVFLPYSVASQPCGFAFLLLALDFGIHLPTPTRSIRGRHAARLVVRRHGSFTNSVRARWFPIPERGKVKQGEHFILPTRELRACPFRKNTRWIRAVGVSGWTAFNWHPFPPASSGHWPCGTKSFTRGPLPAQTRAASWVERPARQKSNPGQLQIT